MIGSNSKFLEVSIFGSKSIYFWLVEDWMLGGQPTKPCINFLFFFFFLEIINWKSHPLFLLYFLLWKLFFLVPEWSLLFIVNSIHSNDFLLLSLWCKLIFKFSWILKLVGTITFLNWFEYFYWINYGILKSIF